MNQAPRHRHFWPRLGTGLRAVALGLAAGGLCAAAVLAAELRLEDGVVVKFGTDAQLVVRDHLVAGSAVTLTSVRDDSVGGQTAPTAQTPAPGQWRGLRLEKSAAQYGGGLSDMSLRYAGGSDGTGASGALTVRGWAPPLSFLQFSNNVLALQLLDGASPVLQGASFLGNATGLQTSGASAPTVTQTQFVGNTLYAAQNLNPTGSLRAQGNWWGDATGPKDAVANPQGKGDALAGLVDFADYLPSAPLLNPSVRLLRPANYVEQRLVTLALQCFNATEYRIAEADAFVGVAFQPLSNGRIQLPFTLSAGEGRKRISVQFRDASGNVVSAALAGGVLYDTSAPVLALTNPTAGSVVNQSIAIQATATDGAGVTEVRFYIDNTLVYSTASAPYSMAWNTETASVGTHTIKVVAYDEAGRTAEQSVSVRVERVVQAPDTDGPTLSNLRLDGAPVQDGTRITRSATLSFSATDRSGVARVDLLRDGVVVATGNGNGDQSLPLSITAVANGNHVYLLRAVDSLGNTSSSSTFTLVVEHTAPDAPTLIQPGSGLVTRDASVTVVGVAAPSNTVRLLRNGDHIGAALTAASDGRFTASLALLDGSNLVQATASDSYGTSALSAGITITRDSAVPTGPSGLSAQSLTSGRIKLAWTRPTDPNVVGYQIYRAQRSFSALDEATQIAQLVGVNSSYEDMPSTDGTWTYRVIAVNAAGTASLPSNLASAVSDNTLPKALSIAYASLGKVDTTTGRYGQGRMNVTLTVSEPLQSTPYLAVVPAGGAPITVELVKSTDTLYLGNFLIDANTPAGTANALFSARDMVGNRGTDIDAGATLAVETDGPILSTITLRPSTPIKVDASPTVQATFVYNKAPAATPQIKYLLSGPLRTATLVSGLARVDALTYSASFSLPADAGLGQPEVLTFSQRALDGLENVSTVVAAFNRYQVYQGNLPPLDIPLGLAVKAQPGGKVKLSWQAVADVSSYQIYRKGPGQSVLVALARTGGTDYIDQVPADGVYSYALASVRQANGQESISGQTAAIEVTASANGPGAPQNLTLTLTGQGIYAAWQPPLSSTVDYYNLYRSTGTRITSITGLTPIKTRVKSPQTYDNSPSPYEGAYVVTAVDAAGNESAISNSMYLNASLLPVRNIRVEQLGNTLPVVSWDAPNGSVAGYTVYVGPDASKVKLTPSPISGTSFTDSGYTSGERRYTVATVDANRVEFPHTVTLPNVSSQIVSGLPLKRGIMNRLQVQVSNTSAIALETVKAFVRVPIDRYSTQFVYQKSPAFSLGSNETKLVTVIVGGYADLPGAPSAQVGVEIVPAEGELVRISRDQTLAVSEGGLVVGMATEEFVRGSTGKLKLTIENTSEVEVELLTAANNGATDSSEMRFKILDADGNVLATQPYKQVLGANVVTLTNGQTVARIPAGSSYVSDIFALNVPNSSPNNIRIRLEVDTLRYHSGQEDEVLIAGRGSERTVSLLDTAYLGEVTDVSPINSFGDQDVIIKGRALDRAGKTPLANTRLKLVLNQQGFERVQSVITDGTGEFVYTFKPTFTDGGLYKVSAVHPDITDRPEQKSFTISRVTVGPTPYALDVPQNYPFTIPFYVQAGVGTSANNLRLVLNAANQPTGQIPAGVSVQLPPSVNLVERQTLNLPVQFVANNDAQPSGALIFDVHSDEHANSPIGQVRVDYRLSEAKPYLVSTPSLIETGLAQGGSQVESVSVKNNGLQEALNLRFTLTKVDGSPAPAWVSIGSSSNGTLAIGQSKTIDLAFSPPSGTPEGVYEFRLTVNGDNVPSQSLNVYASVTQSGQGNVLFKASDIFTATVGKDGRLIAGLAGARIVIQNEDVPTISPELVTDGVGEAFFQALPSGRYKFRASADNHQEIGGRLIVKPGITANQAVFLKYNTVTVEWTVREITIQDRYEITLNATFETDVPAAVIVMEPAGTNLPKMASGDVFYGELKLTNYGLIRADNVQQTLPSSNAYFRYEFLTNMPSSLEAKQRITIPYRVVALQSLDDAASNGSASGGGCFNYSDVMLVSADFVCRNGALSQSSTSASWFAYSNSTCPGVGTGSSSDSASASWFYDLVGSLFGKVSNSTLLKLKTQKCVYVPNVGPTQCRAP